MTKLSRLRLLEGTWFDTTTSVGPLVIGPVTVASYLLMERIGHPLLAAEATVEVTPEMLLDYAWIHSTTYDAIRNAMLAEDPAAHVRAWSEPLGARLNPHHLAALEECMMRGAAEVAAAATRLVETEGKPPAGQVEPAPTSVPRSLLDFWRSQERNPG